MAMLNEDDKTGLQLWLSAHIISGNAVKADAQLAYKLGIIGQLDYFKLRLTLPADLPA